MDPKVDSDFNIYTTKNQNRYPNRIVLWKSIKLQTLKIGADLANMYLNRSTKRRKKLALFMLFKSYKPKAFKA